MENADFCGSKPTASQSVARSKMYHKMGFAEDEPRAHLDDLEALC